jgi:hypothetical protein
MDFEELPRRLNAGNRVQMRKTLLIVNFSRLSER